MIFLEDKIEIQDAVNLPVEKGKIYNIYMTSDKTKVIAARPFRRKDHIYIEIVLIYDFGADTLYYYYGDDKFYIDSVNSTRIMFSAVTGDFDLYRLYDEFKDYRRLGISSKLYNEEILRAIRYSKLDVNWACFNIYSLTSEALDGLFFEFSYADGTFKVGCNDGKLDIEVTYKSGDQFNFTCTRNNVIFNGEVIYKINLLFSYKLGAIVAEVYYLLDDINYDKYSDLNLFELSPAMINKISIYQKDIRYEHYIDMIDGVRLEYVLKMTNRNTEVYIYDPDNTKVVYTLTIKDCNVCSSTSVIFDTTDYIMETSSLYEVCKKLYEGLDNYSALCFIQVQTCPTDILSLFTTYK